MTSPFVTDLIPQRPASRIVGYTALFWLASAVVHTGIFLVSDSAWAGSVSWRKPIVFAFSFAMILWAFGWALDRLPDRPKMARRLAITFAASSTFEVGLISMQAWRGRPSHFSFEGFDGIVFSLMAVAVVFISVCILVVFVWALRRPPADRVAHIALVSGFVMIITGLGIGQWLIELGNSYASDFDRVPETLVSGEAGVPKFPHGIAFHGMQVFMIAAALLHRSGIDAARAARTMWTIVISYGGILIFSMLQSFGGRAPLDLNVVSGPLLTVSVIVLALSMITAVPTRHGSTRTSR